MAGQDVLEIWPPFGRVVEPSSPMAKKLIFDPAWIDLQSELES